MSQQTDMSKNKSQVRGPLVEDASVVGGLDANGAPIIRPKTPEGRADESVTPTDPREQASPPQ